MPDATGAITLSAALLAGLAGSGHCFAMCGALAGALGMRTRSSRTSASTPLADAVLYNAGRLSSYALAGAVVGLIGRTLQAALDLSKFSAGLRLGAAALLVLISIRMLLGWNALAWLERLGARFWRKIQPLARTAAGRNGAHRTLLLGFVWGWLPCGLVYSMLLFAAMSGSALSGAAIMLAFGLGTIPSMLTSGMLAAQIHGWLRQRWPRVVSGALLLVFGVWLGFAAIRSSGQGHQHAATEHVSMMQLNSVPSESLPPDLAPSA